jgi:hypothetical protein
MDVRFRGKSGRAADITDTTEFDPQATLTAFAIRRPVERCAAHPLTDPREFDMQRASRKTQQLRSFIGSL